MQLAHHLSGPLAAYIEKIWYCDGYQVTHRKNLVLPNGKFQLVISLAEGPLRAPGGPPGELGESASSLVLGIRSHFGVIDTATLKSAMGVLFWPAGARAFFDGPADSFYNQNVPLDLIWGSTAIELRDRLREASTADDKFHVLETALLERMNRRLELHAGVRYALVAIALHLRRRPDFHKRFMVLACCSILLPAIGRIPYVWDTIGFWGLVAATEIPPLACILYDTIKHRRLHPAFGWGGAAVWHLFRHSC